MATADTVAKRQQIVTAKDDVEKIREAGKQRSVLRDAGITTKAQQTSFETLKDPLNERRKLEEQQLKLSREGVGTAAGFGTQLDVAGVRGQQFTEIEDGERVFKSVAMATGFAEEQFKRMGLTVDQTKRR